MFGLIQIDNFYVRILLSLWFLHYDLHGTQILTVLNQIYSTFSSLYYRYVSELVGSNLILFVFVNESSNRLMVVAGSGHQVINEMHICTKMFFFFYFCL